MLPSCNVVLSSRFAFYQYFCAEADMLFLNYIKACQKACVFWLEIRLCEGHMLNITTCLDFLNTSLVYYIICYTLLLSIIYLYTFIYK